MLNLSGGTCQKIMRYNLKRLTELSRLCLKCNKRKKCSYVKNDHVIQPLLQKFTPIRKQQNQELLLFIVRGIRSQLKLPLLLTSSAHSPPAPPRPISYSITQLVIARTQRTMCILGLFWSYEIKIREPHQIGVYRETTAHLKKYSEQCIRDLSSKLRRGIDLEGCLLSCLQI